MKNSQKVTKPLATARTKPEGQKTEGPAKPGQKRLDWQRIQADHSTGQFTDVELARKHGTHAETISRRRTRDRATNPAAWPVDRSKDVQVATAALLMHEGVKATLNAGHGAEAVMVAAHVAKDVILSHRHEIKDGRRVAAALMAELESVTVNRDGVARMLQLVAGTLNEADAAALVAQARELVKLHSRVGSVQKLADAMQRLQGLERKAFGIADDDAGTSPLDTMSVGELEAEVARLSATLAGG